MGVWQLNISQVMWLWQFQNFTNRSPLALGWDTQWCIESEKTRFKHQRPHNSCFLVKHLELASAIYSLCKFNFQTSISSLFIGFCLTKWHCAWIDAKWCITPKTM